MRIALAAEEAAGLQALKRCLAGPHEVVLLLSGEACAEPESGLATAAKDREIEIAEPGLVRDAAFGAELRRRSVDVLLNVHSLYRVHETVLSAPAIGSFNLHPGPLPEFAGINTVSWALYEGATEYGSTLHWLATGIDTGPIAYATRFPVDPGMTAGRLMSRSVREGLALIERFLVQLASNPGGIPRQPQDRRQRRYYGHGVPADGRVDWQRWSARKVEAFVRACDYDPYPSPWGQARADINGVDVHLTRVAVAGRTSPGAPGAVERTPSGGVLVATRDGWVDVTRARVQGRQVAGSELSALIGVVVDVTDTRTAVLTFFRDTLNIEVSDPSEDLIEQGRFDSLGIVELFFFMERKFGVTVDLASLEMDQLRSVDAICELIQRGAPLSDRAT